MNSRKVSLYKIAVGVALVVISATSCKSKNDDVPPPVNPYADMLPYLPSVISTQNMPIDSFVYNNDNTVASMFESYNSSQRFANRMDFTYDQSGRCTVIKGFRDGTLSKTITVIYDGLKVTEIISYPKDANLANDTARYFFDKNNMLAQIESKDTVRSAKGEKTVGFGTLSTDGSNVLSYKYHYFYTGMNEGVPFVDTRDYTETYSYDTKKNALQLFFARNPLMAFIVNWNQYEMGFTMGKNNLVARVEKEEAPGKETSINNYTVENTFEEKTGLLTKMVATSDNRENQTTFKFSYIPAK